MTQQIELTYDELFLLEMAVDEVLWKLENDSPLYQRYHSLNSYLLAMRNQFTVGGKKNEKDSNII